MDLCLLATVECIVTYRTSRVNRTSHNFQDLQTGAKVTNLWQTCYMAKPYVSTATAAKALDVGLSTLLSWAHQGKITPAWVSPGNHFKWDIDDLRRQLGMPKGGHDMTDSTVPEPQPVVASIVTSNLGVLITRRNDGSPPWGFLTGEIEPGESPADAAIRECKEEAGLAVKPNYIIGRRVHPKTNRVMVYMAATPTHGTNVFVGDPDELAEVKWASLQEANELLSGMFTPVKVFLESKLAV